MVRSLVGLGPSQCPEARPLNCSRGLNVAAICVAALALGGCGTDIYFGRATAASVAGAGGDGSGGGISASCAGNKGPVPVPLDSYCIDSTEVSEAQYAQFLATEPSLATQPADCSWNEYFEPQPSYMDAPRRPYEPERADFPVTQVDYCDARAYCDWAGKRLCGRRGGGSLPLEQPDNAQESEWFQACSGGGVTAYPYGQDFDAARCAVAAPQHEVGVQGSCEGGARGVFDLIGNVWEWEGSCNDDASMAPEDVICSRRGGATTVDPPTWSCADRGDPSARNTRQVDMGVRCCSDLVK